MPSSGPGHPEDDWDQVERWTRRVARLAAVGVPSWLILLVAFNEEWTGIPWVAGFAMASVLATIITVVADRIVFTGARRGLGPFGRALIAWGVVFVVLAAVMSAGSGGSAAVVLIPFIGATLIAGGVELARRAVNGRRWREPR